MSASSRVRRALHGVLQAAPKALCTRCATSRAAAMAIHPFRSYSSSAGATVTTAASSPTEPPASVAVPASAETIPPLTPQQQQQPPQPPPPPPQRAYTVRAGIILSRPPLLTRRLHPFENAFYFYQKRLEQRVSEPFITSIYFKPDTARRLDWDVKVGERRGSVAKELGEYHGRGARAWNDELLVGDELSSQEGMLDCLLKDAEARVSDDAEMIAPKDVVPAERPLPKETEADGVGDVRRLDRKLDRTLYLVVNGEDGWGFPADRVGKDENLHETAKRTLDTAAGINMNTWMVGRVPVAHIVQNPVLDPDDGATVVKKGLKTFFLKARIMAGQANLAGNPFGYTDFRWLTAEELRVLLPRPYFFGVRNMLSLR